jgi:hypothetical protein
MYNGRDNRENPGGDNMACSDDVDRDGGGYFDLDSYVLDPDGIFDHDGDFDPDDLADFDLDCAGHAVDWRRHYHRCRDSGACFDYVLYPDDFDLDGLFDDDFDPDVPFADDLDVLADFDLDDAGYDDLRRHYYLDGGHHQ